MAFVRGKSGNPRGRPRGVIDAIRQEWSDWVRGMLNLPAYRANLQRRAIAGELAPILEAKLYAYAYGEPPKTDSGKGGLVVNIGFLGEGGQTPEIVTTSTTEPVREALPAGHFSSGSELGSAPETE